MAGTLTEVTDTNFQAEVIESQTPVLVDFWAPWCGPCRVVAPVLEEIASERPDDLRIVKLNVDENQQTAARYQVLSIPTMILFKNGSPAKTVVGAYPKKKLEAELEPALDRRLSAGSGLARRLRPGCPGTPAQRDRQRQAVDLGLLAVAVPCGAVRLGDAPSPSRLNPTASVSPARCSRWASAASIRAGAPDSHSSIRSSTCSPAVLRAFCTACTISRAALAAQVVVQREVQRDRVGSLALDRVALRRAHRQDHVLR